MPTSNQIKVNVVLGAVQEEADSAMAAHGSMRSTHEAYAVILEELDEFWDEVKKNPKKLTDEQWSQWRKDMRKELIQTSAMATRAIIDLNLMLPIEQQQAEEIERNCNG